MDRVWEKLHASQQWGKYPAIDLVKTVMGHCKRNELDVSALRVLEIGCGAGANLSFLLAEGFQVWGVDGSISAIENAKSHLLEASKHGDLDLHVADFLSLPYESDMFDIVIDNLAVYANNVSSIERSYNEVYRVLKKNGYFYSRVWGRETLGYDASDALESGTLKSPKAGPCKDMGTSHFFSQKEFSQYFSNYRHCQLRQLIERHTSTDYTSEEFVMWAMK